MTRYLTVSCILIFLLLLGCGSHAIRVHTQIAQSLLELQAETGPQIRELRIAAAVDAAKVARDQGLPQEEAQKAARETARKWQCAIDAHRFLALAVGNYVDMLQLWAQDTSIDPELLPFIRDASDAYAVLSACLANLGVTNFPRTPQFERLLPESWRPQ